MSPHLPSNLSLIHHHLISLRIFIINTQAIDVTINYLSKRSGQDHHDHHDITDSLNKVKNDNVAEEPEEVVVAPCSSCRANPAKDLEEWQQKAEEEEQQQMKNAGGATLASGSIDNVSDTSEGVSVGNRLRLPEAEQDEERVELSGVQNVVATKKTSEEVENNKLVRMGMQTAVAIALHNFPEGLATFVAVLEDPKIGAVLACAIGIHNIPEGFCVALPIYYATGNRTKAFWWGALSGMSEPIGALLGWIVLANSFSDAMYGLMFGIVSGMMVMISLKELLPTAYRYDPEDTVVTNSLIAGMAIISLSLVLYYV